MFSFIGYKCPVCGKPFAEGDDIVVCPDCGAPYHRECYHKLGRCQFESLHSPSFVWKPSPQEEEAAKAARTIPCPACGTQVPGNSNFCPNCGTALSGQAGPAQGQAQADPRQAYRDSYQRMSASQAYREAFGTATLDDIPIPDWEAFLGRSSAIYLTVFGRMKQTGRRMAMNLSAFFFGPLYFFYRKMWRWGLIFSAIFFVLNAPFLLLMLQISGSPVASGLNPDALYSAASLCSWLTWAVMFVRGFFAHHLYRQEAARKIRQISQALPQGEGRAEALRRSGGVSWKGVILFALLVVLLDGLVAALLGPNLTALYSLMGF